MKTVDYYMADFETSVYDGQTETEVWAVAIVPFYSEDVLLFSRIEALFRYFKTLKNNSVIYFHNLKFDGSFILDFLERSEDYNFAYYKKNNGDIKPHKKKNLENNTYSYVISDRGQWYTIILKIKGKIIEIRDSTKLLPFSVKRIGESFGTKHKKLTMEYEGYRKSGQPIPSHEQRYIKNDVLVPKEALELMLEQGHTSMTIGSCCLKEFKSIITGRANGDYFKIDADEYYTYFPNNLDAFPLMDDTQEGFVRSSFRGGWCYAAPGKINKPVYNGVTLDVNSLYPSMMHSKSGNYFPIGVGKEWIGNYIPRYLRNTPYNKSYEHLYYFVRIQCRFQLKKGKLPTIQIKGVPRYRSNQWLVTSDIWNAKTGEYSRYYKDLDGNVKDSVVELTLSKTDYELFREHYNVFDFEILGGVYYMTRKGIFDEYIDKYMEIKANSTGAVRELAKLFLNNLYGKLAASDMSSYKVAYLNENDFLSFQQYEEHEKQPGYIPIGAAITSYARNFTIRHAQKNYHGYGKPGFCYADTDSNHNDVPEEELIGYTIHKSDLCAWKLESKWDEARFVRQKTYMEHIISEEKPRWAITCAGLPERCKKLFEISMGAPIPRNMKLYDDEIVWINKRRTPADFCVGLKVPGCLKPKRIKGGIILKRGYFEMRPIK